MKFCLNQKTNLFHLRLCTVWEVGRSVVFPEVALSVLNVYLYLAVKYSWVHIGDDNVHLVMLCFKVFADSWCMHYYKCWIVSLFVLHLKKFCRCITYVLILRLNSFTLCFEMFCSYRMHVLIYMHQWITWYAFKFQHYFQWEKGVKWTCSWNAESFFMFVMLQKPMGKVYRYAARPIRKGFLLHSPPPFTYIQLPPPSPPPPPPNTQAHHHHSLCCCRRSPIPSPTILPLCCPCECCMGLVSYTGVWWWIYVVPWRIHLCCVEYLLK